MKRSLLLFFLFACFTKIFSQTDLVRNTNFYFGECKNLWKDESSSFDKANFEPQFQLPLKAEKTDRKFTPPNMALSPGMIFQKQTFGEINLLVGRYESSMTGNALYGIRMGAESNFRNGDQNIWAPKIGVELSGIVICMRVTTLYYVTEGNNQWRFLPELGISFLGFANLTYGYNFRLSGEPLDGIVNHRVCLSLNLNPQLMGDVFGF